MKKRTEYRVNEAQATVIREIFQRYAEGDGLRTIVKALNERGVPSPQAGRRGTGSWSLSVVRPMLRRTRYIGELEYGRTRKAYKKGTKVREQRSETDVVHVAVPHLRIVSDELWRAVQGRFRKNERKPWAAAAGRKPKYMLSSLARCSECGGPIHAKRAKIGGEAAMVYLCGYFQDRAACKNSLRRSVDEVNAGCATWLKDNILREEVVVEILKEVRRRIAVQAQDAGAETAQLEDRARRLRKEIENLAEAIARTNGSVPVLADKLAERQEQLSTIDARLKLQKTAPDALSLQVRRLEAEARKRIDHLRELLDGDQEEARKVLESLLDGPLTFTPIETADGRRYRVEGRVATGALLQVPPDPQCGRPQGDSNPR